MQCIACQFENLPGLSVCARCGSPLALAAVDIEPPRASRLRVRTRLTRAWNGLPSAGPAAATVRALIAPLETAPVPWRAALYSVVPGGGQLQLGRRALGFAILGLWAVAMLTALLWVGSFTGSLACTLAMAVHTTAFVWLLGDNLSFERPVVRAIFGLAALAGIYLTIYAPGAWLMARFVRVIPIAVADTTLNVDAQAVAQDGDVFIAAGPWLQSAPIRRGDLAAYALEEHQLPGVIIRAGLNIDRVLGLPGETVTFRDGRIWVNGELLPPETVPLAKSLPSADVSWTLASSQYLILPSLLAARQQVPEPLMSQMMLQLATVDEGDLIGRVVFRLRPWSRFGDVR